MAAEREVIMKTALPRLKELAQQRGLFLVGVDLRWGITSEDTEKVSSSPSPPVLHSLSVFLSSSFPLSASSVSFSIPLFILV